MNIFEMLDNKFDLKEKIKNLSKLLLEKKYFTSGGYYVSFEEYFNYYYFRKWKYSYGCYDLQEFRIQIGLSYSKSTFNDEYFYAKNEISAVNFLQYAFNSTQFVYGCVYRDGSINSDKREFYEIFDNQFKYILSKIGQKVIKDPKEDYYILVPCNDKTTRCAEIQNKKDVAFLLYEYTSSLLIRDVDRKRKILKLLWSDVEPIINKNLRIYSSGTLHDIFDNLSSIYNNFNIRHNNSDPIKQSYYHEALKTFSNSDYENIYDAAYDLILDAILIDEYSSSTKETYEKYKLKAGL